LNRNGNITVIINKILYTPKTNTKMKTRRIGVLTVLLSLYAATFAQGLKDAGVPIHGIGMQGHYDDL